MKELTDKEIISLALREYEENHWETESQKWQKNINKLMEKYQNEK